MTKATETFTAKYMCGHSNSNPEAIYQDIPESCPDCGEGLGAIEITSNTGLDELEILDIPAFLRRQPNIGKLE